MNSLGAVIGALVMIITACTPPPGPSAVDRINFYTVDGERIYSLQVLEPDGPLPSGFVENTSTSSTIELTAEVFYSQSTATVSVSCVEPKTPVGAGVSCSAEGTSVTQFSGSAEVYEGVLAGTLTTAGPQGSITAVFDGILSGQPYGIPDSHVEFSVYDGAPSVP